MKKKKYQRGGFEQGFRAREDESLGMRTGPNALNSKTWRLVVLTLMVLGEDALTR